MTQKILVTGATGTVGKAVISSLLAKGASVKAASRNAPTSGAFTKHENSFQDNEVNPVHFDFEDTSTFKAATEGIDAVFLLGPPLVTNLDELVQPFIDHLKSEGIKRVVYLAAFGLDKVKELPFHENIVNKLQQDGFELTVLRPTFFSQNFKNFEWENIVNRGVIFVTAGTGKVAFVDVDDIGAVAAVALTEPGHVGKSYIITGPQSMSYFDAAELISEVTGNKVVYANPSPEEFTNALKAAGAPDFIAPYMNAVYSMIANNFVDYVSPVVKKLTGKEPTALRTVLKRDFVTVPA